MKNTSAHILRLTQIALLTALIVVLQLFSNFIKIGTFSPTLALVPIVVGACLFGPGAGAFLGFVFGVITAICAATGLDGGGAQLWQISPVLTTLLCLSKATAAGFAAGAISRAFREREKSRAVGTVVAALATPVVNTGLFLCWMGFVFTDKLTEWAGGKPIAAYIIVGLVGINFLLELALNILLSSAIVRLVEVLRKRVR